MSKRSTQDIKALFEAGRQTVVSLEENDVNININADVDAEPQDEAAAEPVAAEPVVEADVDAVPLDTSDTPEAAELDATEAGADVEATADDVEELDNTLESLEAIHVALESIQTQGLEFTPAAAQLLHVALGNAVGHYGLTPAAVGVASVEDFEVAPLSSQEVSMEAVGDTIKAAAESLVKFLKELLANIVNFVKGIFSAVEAAKQKNEKVIKALADAKATKNEITLPGILNGQLSAAKVKGVAGFIEAVVKTKTADIEAAVRGSSVTSDEIKSRFTALYQGVKDGVPGQITVGISDGYPTITYADGESKKIKTPSLSELQATAKANQALIAAIAEYKSAEAARKKMTDVLIANTAANKFSEAKEGDGNVLVELVKARRSAANLWSKRIAFETKAIGKALAYANAVNNALASAIDKKAPAKKEEA